MIGKKLESWAGRVHVQQLVAAVLSYPEVHHDRPARSVLDGTEQAWGRVAGDLHLDDENGRHMRVVRMDIRGVYQCHALRDVVFAILGAAEAQSVSQIPVQEMVMRKGGGKRHHCQLLLSATAYQITSTPQGS